MMLNPNTLLVQFGKFKLVLGWLYLLVCIPRCKLYIEGEIIICEACPRVFELFVNSLGMSVCVSILRRGGGCLEKKLP